MIEPDPVPRPYLFLRRDVEAWSRQFHLLFYVLRMTPMQIAQIDYGFDPDHPDAWLVFSWAREIERLHPFVDVGPMIRRARK